MCGRKHEIKSGLKSALAETEFNVLLNTGYKKAGYPAHSRDRQEVGLFAVYKFDRKSVLLMDSFVFSSFLLHII